MERIMFYKKVKLIIGVVLAVIILLLIIILPLVV
jgi:hypothetical protein